MSHTLVNFSTTISSFESTPIEPTFKVMKLPPLESTTKALSIFSENEINEWQDKKHPQHPQHQHPQRQHHHKRQQRKQAKTSVSNFKSKVLPTRTISRGLFKGCNDMRRFNCFSEECSLNFDVFRNCGYCRHIPYIPSPLKGVEYSCKYNNNSNYASDDEDKDKDEVQGLWGDIDHNNNERENDEEYDAFNDYLCQWKQQQNINKIRVPQEVSFIAPREKSKQRTLPSRSISNTLSKMSTLNERRIPHEQHPSKLFNSVCKSNNKDELNHKVYGMIDLLRNSYFQLKQKFIDMKHNLGEKMTKAQRSISAPSDDIYS